MRLAHMIEKWLKILTKKSLIPFFEGAVLNPCDYCLFGKHHRVSFHTSFKRKTKLLNLVYYDVCGLIEVESIGDNKYFLTFINDIFPYFY